MSIKWLYEHTLDELDGSKKYAKKALKLKEDGKTEYASIFTKLAEQEYTHAEMLMDICKDMEVKQNLDVHVEVWNYMKECLAEKIGKVKAYLSMLK